MLPAVRSQVSWAIWASASAGRCVTAATPTFGTKSTAAGRVLGRSVPSAGAVASVTLLHARHRDLATGRAEPRDGGAVARGDPHQHPVGKGCSGCSQLGDAISALSSTPLGYRLLWPGSPGTGVGHSDGLAGDRQRGDDGVRLAASCLPLPAWRGVMGTRPG